jgi:hypothetical protein
MPTKKKKTVDEIDVRSLARSYTDMAIRQLAGIAQNGDKDAARVTACGILLDRGWGKAAQPLTGANGSEDIQVTIRTIIAGKDKK